MYRDPKLSCDFCYRKKDRIVLNVNNHQKSGEGTEILICDRRAEKIAQEFKRRKENVVVFEQFG